VKVLGCPFVLDLGKGELGVETRLVVPVAELVLVLAELDLLRAPDRFGVQAEKVEPDTLVVILDRLAEVVVALGEAPWLECVEVSISF
jgi:hypothetical protein